MSRGEGEHYVAFVVFVYVLVALDSFSLDFLLFSFRGVGLRVILDA
jgi:hypothetical protein